MSRVEALFSAIESQEFAAVANLASDLKTFVRILRSEKAVGELAAQMGDISVAAAVAQRMAALALDAGDDAQEHPWDSALAAYLWLLAGSDPTRAKAAAGQLAAAPRCWWAAKLAEQVLSADHDKMPAATPSPVPAPQASNREP
jgi:hypothetical protein